MTAIESMDTRGGHPDPLIADGGCRPLISVNLADPASLLLTWYGWQRTAGPISGLCGFRLGVNGYSLTDRKPRTPSANLADDSGRVYRISG